MYNPNPYVLSIVRLLFIPLSCFHASISLSRNKASTSSLLYLIVSEQSQHCKRYEYHWKVRRRGEVSSPLPPPPPPTVHFTSRRKNDIPHPIYTHRSFLGPW
jgi:hypothetical protein